MSRRPAAPAPRRLDEVLAIGCGSYGAYVLPQRAADSTDALMTLFVGPTAMEPLIEGFGAMQRLYRQSLETTILYAIENAYEVDTPSVGGGRTWDWERNFSDRELYPQKLSKESKKEYESRNAHRTKTEHVLRIPIHATPDEGFGEDKWNQMFRSGNDKGRKWTLHLHLNMTKPELKMYLAYEADAHRIWTKSTVRDRITATSWSDYVGDLQAHIRIMLRQTDLKAKMDTPS